MNSTQLHLRSNSLFSDPFGLPIPLFSTVSVNATQQLDLFPNFSTVLNELRSCIYDRIRYFLIPSGSLYHFFARYLWTRPSSSTYDDRKSQLYSRYSLLRSISYYWIFHTIFASWSSPPFFLSLMYVVVTRSDDKLFSAPSHCVRLVPWLIARRFQVFLPSSTRVQLCLTTVEALRI